MNVTTQSGCTWTVTNNPSWVVPSLTSASGSATTNVAVQPNSGPARSATIRIAGLDFTIAQEGCTYSVNTYELKFDADDGSKQIKVTTQPGCGSSAKVNASWLRVKPATATGTNTYVVEVDKNTKDDARMGEVTILGVEFARVVTIKQEGDD